MKRTITYETTFTFTIEVDEEEANRNIPTCPTNEAAAFNRVWGMGQQMMAVVDDLTYGNPTVKMSDPKEV